MWIKIVAFFALTLWCCSKTGSTKEANHQRDSLPSSEKDPSATSPLSYDSVLKLDSYFVTRDIDTSKLQIVDVDCAIIAGPTDEQIEEMKKRQGEENFYTIADDNNWYQGIAIEKVDSVGVKIQIARKQFIKCIGENRMWTLDIRKKNMPAWNLIFFKRNKGPKIISSLDVTSDHVRAYFEVNR